MSHCINVKVRTFDRSMTGGRPSERFLQPENISKYLKMRISLFLHVFRATLALEKDRKIFFLKPINLCSYQRKNGHRGQVKPA